MPKSLPFFLGCLLLLAGCHRRPKPVIAPAPPPRPTAPARPPKPPPPPDEMGAVDADDRIYYDDAAAFTDSVRLTINDPETWSRVWTQATKGQASSPALPEIDFRRYLVLLVSAGRMRPGDEIHVDSVGTRKGRTFVVVRTMVDCQPFPGSAYPVEIVRVRRGKGTVVFIEHRAKNGDC